MKSDQDWMPDATDLAWIGSIARAPSPAAMAIGAASGRVSGSRPSGDGLLVAARPGGSGR